ncbi:cobalt ion-binding protein [Prunus dulcis]|uniref:Cobalt ion-binding protein n=1 Tax=Prunus dulcis TaxID=3755 RepID=A0A4Y1RBS1_PRUDU|nr:cobalt ion-binding protein [Prunus dulcis]
MALIRAVYNILEDDSNSEIIDIDNRQGLDKHRHRDHSDQPSTEPSGGALQSDVARRARSTYRRSSSSRAEYWRLFQRRLSSVLVKAYTPSQAWREPFIYGEAVPYDPKYHEEWIRNNSRANERNRRNDRPRNYDRSRNFDRRRENMQNRDFQNRVSLLCLIKLGKILGLTCLDLPTT